MRRGENGLSLSSTDCRLTTSTPPLLRGFSRSLFEKIEEEKKRKKNEAMREFVEEDGVLWFRYQDGRRLRACACKKLFNHCVNCNEKARKRSPSTCVHGNQPTRCKEQGCSAKYKQSASDSRCEHGKTRKICGDCAPVCPLTKKQRNVCPCMENACGGLLCRHLNKRNQRQTASRCRICSPGNALWTTQYNTARHILQTSMTAEGKEARDEKKTVEELIGCSKKEFVEHLAAMPRWEFLRNPKEKGIPFPERMKRFHFLNIVAAQ